MKQTPLIAAVWLLIFTTLALTPVHCLLAESTAKESRQDTRNVTPEEIDVLVRQLGDRDFRVREEAAAKLSDLGAPAFDAVQKASKSDDPEIRIRAQKLLPDIEVKASLQIAKNKQKATAKILNVTVEKEIDLGDNIKLKLVLIPDGEFDMGTEKQGRRTTPLHRVKIPKPFYLGKFEVTQKQYQQVMGDNPSKQVGPDLPVEHVDWNQAVDFCAKVSKKTGLEARLPAEAEWEYACRAGTRTIYYSGTDEADLDKIAWYQANSEGKSHPVGKKAPNAFGLYDMIGNVWEVCEDDWRYGYQDAPDDGKAWVSKPRGSMRVMRGGNWSLNALCNTCFHRSGATLSNTEKSTYCSGFRVVVSLPTKPPGKTDDTKQ